MIYLNLKVSPRSFLFIACSISFLNFSTRAFSDTPGISTGSAPTPAPVSSSNAGNSDDITATAFGLMDQWKVSHPAGEIKMESVSPVSKMTQDVYVYKGPDNKTIWKASVMSLFPIQYSFIAYPSKGGDILTYFPMSALLVRKTTAADLAKGMDPLMVVKGGSMAQLKAFCKTILTEKTDSGYAVKCVLDASKLNNPQVLMMHISEVPMEIDLDANGQVNRTTQTVLGMTTVSTLKYVSFDNAKVLSDSPPTPDESTLDPNLTYQDALAQEVKFFKTKPQPTQTTPNGI